MEPSAKILGLFLYICWFVTYLLANYINHKMTLFVSCMLFLFASAAMVRVKPNNKGLKKKHIFLTSADTNYGVDFIQFLCGLKAYVYAGCRDLSAPEMQRLKKKYSEYLHLFQFDVTCQKEVDDARQFVENNLGSNNLYALINNSQILCWGDLQLKSVKTFEEIFQVNYFGAVRVCHTFLPLLQSPPSGDARIINLSCLRARHILPFYGAYSDSKVALEAFSDALRLEQSRFQVKVILLEPSHFNITHEIDDIKMPEWENLSAHLQTKYGEQYVQELRSMFHREQSQTSSTQSSIIAALHDALATENPKDRYTIGASNRLIDLNKISAILSNFFPTSLMDWLIELIYIRPLMLPAALQSNGHTKRDKKAK